MCASVTAVLQKRALKPEMRATVFVCSFMCKSNLGVNSTYVVMSCSGVRYQDVQDV